MDHGCQEWILANKVLNYVLLIDHWGSFRYTRLPFGVKTAGDIFIQEMNEILQYLEGVHAISNDILIHGLTIKRTQ